MPRDGAGDFTKLYPDVVTGTTISSSVHNGTINDFVTDANTVRPIKYGGTGGNSPSTARANLQAEVSGVQVTNYDTHPFEPGSFWSDGSATAGPVASSYVSGICHWLNSGAMLLEAYVYGGPAFGTTWRRWKWTTWGAWEQVTNPNDKVSKTGDTMSGPLTVYVPGNQFGGAGGNATTPTTANTNILFYNNGSDNWAGMGSDTGGNIYAVAGIGVPATRMFISNAGNVGIGTLAPTRKLEVGGVIQVTENAALTGISLKNTAAGGRDIQLLAGANGTGVEGGFVIHDNSAGITRLSIYNTGAVTLHGPSLSLSGDAIKTDFFINTQRGGARNYGFRANHAVVGDLILAQGASSGTDPFGGNTIFQVVPGPQFNFQVLVNVQAGVASSSPTTGALVVAGGVGVGGDLRVGGQITSYGGDIIHFLASGTTHGVRIGTNSGGGYIEGVDASGGASYAPLNIGGSQVNVSANTTFAGMVSVIGLLTASGGVTMPVGFTSNGASTIIGSTGNISSASPGHKLEIQAASPNAAYLAFHRSGAYATLFGLDGDNVLRYGGWSMGAVAHTVWHDGVAPGNGAYQKFASSNIMFVWGTTGTGGDRRINFPVAFPSVCMCVVTTSRYANPGNQMHTASAVVADAAGFNIYPRYVESGVAVSGADFSFLAWGY